MSSIALKSNKTINDYCDGIKKLILDIKEEVEKEIKDGIGIKLAAQKGDEASIYSYLKDQGYEMTYNEFYEFYQDSLQVIDDNEEALQKIMEEQISEELNDNDLEQVAGGRGWWKKNWKKVAVGVGIGLVVAAVTVATCGVGGAVAAGGVIAAGATSNMAGLAGAIATAKVCGFVAAGLAAGGVLSITAGTTE